MDLTLSAEQEAFRDELRAWLRENLTDDVRIPRGKIGQKEVVERLKGWQRRLFDGGYVGITWPREFGGRGLSVMEEVILNTELVAARAPDAINVIGLYMAGPTIIAHGTEEQKRTYLPPLLRGDEIWCQGFSEPNSGSDLASLQTRAVRDGDHYVVNGQKVWNTLGHAARWCLLLVRTGAADSRHGGLTYLILDMQAPGVEIRPLRQMTGEAEFNELFFTDVRIPVANLLGDEGGGWGVAMTTLMNERGTLGVGLQVRSRIALEELVALARHSAPKGAVDPVMRQRIAQLAMDIEAMRINSYRGLTGILRGGGPGPEGSINKLMWSEVNQRLCDTALEVVGANALLASDDEAATAGGRWAYAALRSRANSIEGGTSEVLRNILAERVLGLPRNR